MVVIHLIQDIVDEGVEDGHGFGWVAICLEVEDIVDKGVEDGHGFVGWSQSICIIDKGVEDGYGFGWL